MKIQKMATWNYSFRRHFHIVSVLPSFMLLEVCKITGKKMYLLLKEREGEMAKNGHGKSDHIFSNENTLFNSVKFWSITYILISFVEPSFAPNKLNVETLEFRIFKFW